MKLVTIIRSLLQIMQMFWQHLPCINIREKELGLQVVKDILKALDTIGFYSTIVLVVSIKTYLVRSNGKLMIVWNIVRNGSLWSNVDFEKEVIFHEFDFDTSESDFEVPKSSIWKLCATKGVFSSIVISQLRQQIEIKISQFFYAFDVEIHYCIVKRMVFDSYYQRCPVSLNVFAFNKPHCQ